MEGLGSGFIHVTEWIAEGRGQTEMKEMHVKYVAVGHVFQSLLSLGF